MTTLTCVIQNSRPEKLNNKSYIRSGIPLLGAQTTTDTCLREQNSTSCPFTLEVEKHKAGQKQIKATRHNKTGEGTGRFGTGKGVMPLTIYNR